MFEVALTMLIIKDQTLVPVVYLILIATPTSQLVSLFAIGLGVCSSFDNVNYKTKLSLFHINCNSHFSTRVTVCNWIMMMLIIYKKTSPV